MMSGTSADGIDASLIDFSGSLKNPSWEVLNCSSISYTNQLREKIISLAQGQLFTSEHFLDISVEITNLYLDLIRITDPGNISEVIGCHGQTIWHKPPKNEINGAS